jgi:hypothetical protein
VQDFFAQRYTSVFAITFASDTIQAADDSTSLQIHNNEITIDHLRRHQLLSLSDSPPDFDVVTLLREKNLIPQSGEPEGKLVEENSLALNWERWEGLLRAGINQGRP